MSSGSYHNRNRNRDSPSTPVSARPRSNSKNSSESSQKNRNTAVNGKMPSVANSPTSDHITDGMANLTLDNIRYPVGSKVTAKLSKSGTIMKGEVVAYDSAYKVVIIKSNGSRSGRNNVTLVNLAHCSEIKIDEEGKEPPGELTSLNTARLEQRTKDSIEKKKKLIMAFKVGISPEGQKLFQTINKTIDDVMWNGDKIRVMGCDIEPPYKVENIKCSPDNKAITHIRKIVDKHYRDQESAKSPASSATSALSVTSPSAASSVAPESNPSANSRTTPTVTPSIPNLPQAPAPPSSHSGSSTTSSNKGTSNFRSNRNNVGRNYNRGHHENHPKPMYNN